MNPEHEEQHPDDDAEERYLPLAIRKPRELNSRAKLLALIAMLSVPLAYAANCLHKEREIQRRRMQAVLRFQEDEDYAIVGYSAHGEVIDTVTQVRILQFRPETIEELRDNPDLRDVMVESPSEEELMRLAVLDVRFIEIEGAIQDAERVLPKLAAAMPETTIFYVPTSMRYSAKHLEGVRYN